MHRSRLRQSGAYAVRIQSHTCKHVWGTLEGSESWTVRDYVHYVGRPPTRPVSKPCGVLAVGTPGC